MGRRRVAAPGNYLLRVVVDGTEAANSPFSITVVKPVYSDEVPIDGHLDYYLWPLCGTCTQFEPCMFCAFA
jgi:hypothetical protein